MTQLHTSGLVMPQIYTDAVHVSGCVNIGPQSVSRDCFENIGEVARSCKAQALRNILFFNNRALALVMGLLTHVETGAREPAARDYFGRVGRGYEYVGYDENDYFLYDFL